VDENLKTVTVEHVDARCRTMRAHDVTGVVQDSLEEAEVVRATERARLRALVDKDMEMANQLHADDFELINPGGAGFLQAAIPRRRCFRGTDLPGLGSRHGDQGETVRAFGNH
jgi:hypothetical protein